MNIYNELSRPFEIEKIHWRVGATNKNKIARETGDKNAKPTKGVPLAYIDARDVMDRLDFVVGPGNWGCKYPFPGCCELSILIGNQWVVKSNGAGETDFEGAKGQYSDAFKRAGVVWGIGRYLYGLPNVWVDLDNYGKPKTQPKLPQWATPNGWCRIDKETQSAFYAQTLEALENADESGLKELWAEWSNDDLLILWNMFNSKQRTLIKELRK